ncbi:superinfection exclusion B family protein [Tenacibaculum finnmarkense genomovar ulcerans]|uniref:super-infection exclusion protein B n=1 Tax=Tenacibaculum finnmarkense TaxID=2781243 RepID=UPI001E4A114D|nr:super-infection exclusion protein B [Tenacibaculum finnmarkense]MCD8455235.1 superinfection exclusion B family protein [Tenacibaculum finnmarkense genomovar ulcerans]
MAFSFSDLIDFSKIPIKVFLLFAIVSGILLFGNEDFLSQLKLTEFEQGYGKYFGIIFIVCVSFITLSIIYYVFNKINYYFRKKKRNKYLRTELKTLDLFEQSAIREFIVQGKKTVSMPIDNPVISGLINKRILKMVSNIGNGMHVPMSLTRFTHDNLKDQDLGILKNMTDIEIKDICLKRPEWVKDFLYERLNK